MKKIFSIAIGAIGAYFINTQLMGVSSDIAIGITIGCIAGVIICMVTAKHD